MRHDWVFDVLRDLMAYAQENELPALAARIRDTLAVAEAEIAERRDGKAYLSAEARPRPDRPH